MWQAAPAMRTMLVLFMAGMTGPWARGEGLPQGVSNAVTGLTRFAGCELVPTDWADGDSFSVRFPDGKDRSIRLYGADCLEWHVADESDARRLRAQRRYFGISKRDGSIDMAKGLGERGGMRVRELLGAPFTVHTAWADGGGDGRFKRYYGFVTTGAGKDLAAELVREGLARAFGVYRRSPSGVGREEYRQQLVDLELTAASRRVGAWALTDWGSLPDERRVQRAEEAELAEALDGGGVKPGEKINPNSAARDVLMKLPGIGETKANAIIEGRENGKYREPGDLLRVPGIGAKTLEKFEDHLEFGATGSR